MKKALRFFRPILALILVLCLLPLPALALDVEQARQLLEEHYVDGLNDAARQAETLDELFAALGDPYTVYMTQEEYEQFISSIDDDSVVGIGVSVQNAEGGILIASVLADSPALEAGLEAGDIITHVDGAAVSTIEEATARITGEEGTSVRLRVLRRDGSALELELTRRSVVIPTTARYALSEDGTAGLIVCDSFGEGTAQHFLEALQEYDGTVNAWIIDLSANPGGTSEAAAAAAGWFIGGAIMAYFRDGSGDYYYTFTMPYTPVLTEKPAILLTSPYSASGSELFASAIRDYGAGIAVGQRTFGKGIAQITLTQDNYPELFDGDALKVTAYRFFSPDGTTNHQIGVMPTLLLSPENTVNAALLLCQGEPEDKQGAVKLTLAEQDFYIRLEQAVSPEFRSAFVELLEALPPSARLWEGEGTAWNETVPAALAQQLELEEFSPRTFSDLEGCGQANAVNTLAVYRLVGGYEDGTFRPQATLQRGELCALLANLLGLHLSEVSSTPFPDVAPGSWYAPAVTAMHQWGLVSGYEDGTFRPESEVTQEEVLAVLTQLAVWLNLYIYNDALEGPDPEALESFSAFSGWARSAAWLMDQYGVETADLDPQENASRGLTAQLICQLLSAAHVLWE